MGTPAILCVNIVGGVTVIVCLQLKKGLIFIHTPLFVFVSCMKQFYIEALLIQRHTSLKFNSENRNPQIPEIGRKNWPIHP